MLKCFRIVFILLLSLEAEGAKPLEASFRCWLVSFLVDAELEK